MNITIDDLVACKPVAWDVPFYNGLCRSFITYPVDEIWPTPPAPIPPVADFIADNLTPGVTDWVSFTDLSTNLPTSWLRDLGYKEVDITWIIEWASKNLKQWTGTDVDWTQEPIKMFFNTNWTFLYNVSSAFNGTIWAEVVHRSSLNTSYDISTLINPPSGSGAATVVGIHTNNFFIDKSWTRKYVMDGNGIISQYDIIGWTVSNCIVFVASKQTLQTSTCFWFSDDGLQYFAIHDEVGQWCITQTTLSVAWDITTLWNDTFNTATIVAPLPFIMSSDWSHMFFYTEFWTTIYQYNMTVPFDTSTLVMKATYVSPYNIRALCINYTNDSLYICDDSYRIPQVHQMDNLWTEVTSTLQNPTFTYPITWLYTVSLTATNTYWSDTETKVDYINVSLVGTHSHSKIVGVESEVAVNKQQQQQLSSPKKYSVNGIFDCMINFDLGLISHGIVIPPTNDLSVLLWTVEQITSVLNWTILTIWDQQLNLDRILDTLYYISDWENNYEILNHWTLRRVWLDWMHFNVGWGSIEVGLPTPVAQYFTPGRCTTWPLIAYYSWHFGGVTNPVTIVADNAWAAGNITLTFGIWDTINAVIAAWNIGHLTNTITLASGIGTQIPWDGEYIALHWGADANTCQPTDYMPNNKWLVLTRDCVTNQAQWMPPQCCLQQMSFDGANISITINTSEPLQSINTDNQQLSLTLNSPTSELLCLTRRHGGLLGNQIPDPDSCVDLININEHIFDLQWNLLYLLGSDLLINSVVDLNQVNEHTLDLQSDPIDPLHYHDPLFPRHDILDILGSDWLSNGTIDLNWVAQEMLTLMDKLLCVKKIIDPLVACNQCRNDCVDLSILDYDCEDVAACINNVPIDWPTYYPTICSVITDPDMAAAWNNFFCNGPVTINQVVTFINNYITNLQQVINQIWAIIQRQKYRARIFPTDNRTLRSGHNANSYIVGSFDWGQYARWYFPNFDQGEWRNSITTQTIDPARELTDSLDHIIIGTFDQAMPNSWHHYSMSPSTHNPNPWSCGKACDWGGKTIRIPMSWWYDIKLIWTLEVDHNVHAYRYSVLRLRAAEAHTKVDFLLDTKYWGDQSVGSHSVNDTAYPTTKQYNHAASKIMYLEAWDVLFVAVRIDPVTYWTTAVDQQNTLMWTGEFAHIVHTAGSAIWTWVSRSPWSLAIDYANTLNWYWNWKVTTQLPRPASMPPHLSHYEHFTATWGRMWAEDYGYSLRWFYSSDTDYFYDDWCVTVLANPSFAQSDWSGFSPAWFYTPGPTEKYWGSMLSVNRINYEQ